MSISIILSDWAIERLSDWLIDWFAGEISAAAIFSFIGFMIVVFVILYFGLGYKCNVEGKKEEGYKSPSKEIEVQHVIFQV